MQKNGPIGKKWTLMRGYAGLYLGTEKMPQQQFRTQISALQAAHVHFLYTKVIFNPPIEKKYPFWDSEWETCRLQKEDLYMTATGSCSKYSILKMNVS